VWYLLAVLICAEPAGAAAPVTRVDIVIAADTTNLRELSGKIEATLQQQDNLAITVRTRAEADASPTQGALLIGIGDSLLPWIETIHGRYPAAIAFYVSSAQFRTSERPARIAALYRDQPLARQLRLAKLLFPRLQRVGILQGEQALPVSRQQLSSSSGLTIATVSIRDKPDWAKSLSQLLAENDILLGLDDPQMYNSENIHSILLTAYRHGKVLIGPAKPFVNAGGLASCYSDIDQYLQQLGDMVKSYVQTEKLPESQYPKNFQVAINLQVASSLGLTLPDEKTIITRLQNSAEECGNDC
jgi:xanthosine utilization system XapX-like protein